MDKRTPKGQFAPGNSGGPGRPKRATEVEYLAALKESIPLDQWRLVCQKALEDALNGDDKARAWISKYVLSEPKRAEETPIGQIPVFDDDRKAIIDAAAKALGIDLQAYPYDLPLDVDSCNFAVDQNIPLALHSMQD